MLKKYLQKRVYKWHRITSLIIVVPIILWTISGFLMPLMGNFKPTVSQQFLQTSSIDSSKITRSLKDVLETNNISVIESFRIIKWKGLHYYQIKIPNKPELLYIDCSNSTIVKNGDVLYAEYLAQRFLNEPQQSHSKNKYLFGVVSPVGIKTNVKEISLVNQFNSEYNKNNKILPVYKVAFKREDGIRLFIEPQQDRLSAAIDNKRFFYTQFFSFAHTWGFMSSWGNFRYYFIALFSLLCIFSSAFGFYIYNISNKKNTANKKSFFGKKIHRILGNVFILTTLLYSFSGIWHTLKKTNTEIEVNSYSANFKSNELAFNITQFIRPEIGVLKNISIVKIEDENYWQATFLNNKNSFKKYFETKTFSELENGDNLYAEYLLLKKWKNSITKIENTKSIFSFNHQYKMMSKRLPVTQIKTKEGLFFIETSTGELAQINLTKDRVENFVFGQLHMHHYPEAIFGKKIGKPIRNSILYITTLGLVLVAFTGLYIYIKRKRQQFHI